MKETILDVLLYLFEHYFYDDPDAVPAVVHIQVAERLHWMERAHELPTFDRYPPQT